jgi:xanthine dehydrogenase molybdopterin-binding subunit B
MGDVLLIASDEPSAQRLAARLGSGQVMGRAVLAVDTARLENMPGDVQVFTAADRPRPPDVAGLSEAETLFVDAWRSRLDRPAKVRPGDGLPWDAPGFEPPDPTYHDSG